MLAMASMSLLHQSVLEIAQRLIAYPSITPLEAGCLTDLHGLFLASGARSFLTVFDDTTNLYARWGKEEPHLCFAGHIDVVPPGPRDLWTFDPFTPTCHEGFLYGRGVADMKGAIASFIAALFSCLSQGVLERGSCSILLTSDEEGPGINGIPKMIPWMEERGEIPKVILIGEPTGTYTGEVIQVGRRGSVTGQLTVLGTQGHIAYPHLADNPLPRLVKCAHALTSMPLDKGDENFQPSRLELTSIDTGNPASNVIPARAKAHFGIRYTPYSQSLLLCEQVEALCQEQAGNHLLSLQCNGDPFLTKDAQWRHCIMTAIESVTGCVPRLTTQGATTDGRFLCKVAPVLELGLPETTIHQVNERVKIEDLDLLKKIYEKILKNYFN